MRIDHTIRENEGSAYGIDVSAKDSFFDTTRITSDLKFYAVRGGAITLAGQVCRQVIQLVSTVVLARLLIPEDFGLIAMISVVVAFVPLFTDLGLSMATVQRSRINNQQVNALFWVNSGVGLALMLLVMALAPVMAWFYGEPRLFWLTIATAGGVVLNGLAVQHTALLRRQMRFGTLTAVIIGAMAASVAVGIVSALAGAGVWSLVYMRVTESLLLAVGVWIFCPWRPSRPGRATGVRSMLNFGGNVTGFSIINYFARNLDKVLIGRFWGAVPLGFYNKAYGLLLLPIRQVTGPITATAVPTLSRLQDDPEKYRRYYLKAIAFVSFFTMPGVMFMVVMSEGLVRLLLGDQWLAASGIFRCLGIAAFFQPVVGTTGWVFISTGNANRMLRWGLVASSALIASFIVGLPYGALGVAASYAAMSVILVIPQFWYALRSSPVSLLEVVRGFLHPLLASLFAGAVLVILKVTFGQLFSGFFGLALAFAVVGSIYLGIMCLLSKGLAPIRQFGLLYATLRRKQPLTTGAPSSLSGAGESKQEQSCAVCLED